MAQTADVFPTAFVVGAAITVTVQLVMGILQLSATRRLTRLTLDEQRAQLEVKADHDRAAALRDARHVAYLAFLKACYGVVSAAGEYAAADHPVAEEVGPRGLSAGPDDLLLRLPETLRVVGASARDVLEDVRLAGGQDVGDLARELYAVALGVAHMALDVAAARRDGDGLEEAQKDFVTARIAYGNERRAFTALVRSQVWGVAPETPEG
ncbi:hypothetical protein ABT024_31830 [Streptomyces sp. NPDC002812]|uniref:hypothetical protein n=1 Tax=Streptomyces sp. NPDC002812 TaxID=3154434 RepID=UPI00332978B1